MKIILLEFKLQLVPVYFQPPGKLKLELQRLQIERAWWRESRRISKSILKRRPKRLNSPLAMCCRLD
jgi:hypothetical protein